MITAIIGDVHGCKEQLVELLGKLKEVRNYVFLGDLLDKGPDSAGVIKVVRELQTRANVIAIEGNHEEKHRRYRDKVSQNKDTSKMKNALEIGSITQNLSKDDIAFLDAMPLYYKLPGQNITCVHAGIPGAIKILPDSGNRPDKKDAKFFNQMLRIRFENPKGMMVALGQEKPEDVFWSEKYDGRFGHVYYGHQPWNKNDPKFDKFATGMDLGCVFGGWLAAAIVENGKLIDIVRVKGEKHAQVAHDNKMGEE